MYCGCLEGEQYAFKIIEFEINLKLKLRYNILQNRKKEFN